MHYNSVKPISESNFSVELRQESGRIAIIIKTTDASLYETTITDFDSLMVRLINNNSSFSGTTWSSSATNSFQQDHNVSGMTYAYKLDGYQMVGANSGGPSEVVSAFNELHFNFSNGITFDSSGEANINSFIGSLSDFSIDFSYMQNDLGAYRTDSSSSPIPADFVPYSNGLAQDNYALDVQAYAGGITLSIKNLTNAEITASDIDKIILNLNKPDGTPLNMTANQIAVAQNMDTFVNYRMDGMTASTEYNSVELTVPDSSPLVIPANGSIIIGSIAGFTDLESFVVHKAVFNSQDEQWESQNYYSLIEATTTSEPTITYTHIGNVGGTSGIDDTETQYPDETTAVKFQIDQGRLGVVDSSLYTDQGADGTENNEMGVYLDLGMGLASTLLPSANAVSAPKAAIIQEETGSTPSWSVGDGTEAVIFSNYAYDASSGKVSFDVTLNTNDGGVRSIHWHKYDNTTYPNNEANQAKVTFEAADGSPFYADFRYTVFELSTYDGVGTPSTATHYATDYTGLVGRVTVDASLFPDFDPTDIGTFFGDYTTQVVTLYPEGSGGGTDVAFGAYDSGTLTATELYTLNGTTALNALEQEVPWVVELSDHTDIFVGRDSVVDATSTTGYLPGVEVIIATEGNDQIDGGGGYNVADFSELKGLTIGVNYNMGYGDVNFYGANGYTTQTWHGFQEVHGTVFNDTIIGTDETDDELAESIFTNSFGSRNVDYGAGSNVIVGGGGSDTIAGNSGNDMILLGSGSVDDVNSNTEVHGGWGDDLISLGVGNDEVHGGGLNDVSSSSDFDNTSAWDELSVDSDDYYNDTGVDLVYFAFGDGGNDTPDDIEKLTITGDDGNPIEFLVPDTVTSSTTWQQFADIANRQINEHFGNIDANGQVVGTAYKYVEVEDDGITVYLGQGLKAPSTATQGYYYHGEDVLQAPTWASITMNGIVIGANGFAPAGEFVDGSGDDSDVFMASLDSINRDTLMDLDVGQNSLSLAGEVGESIYFGSDFTGVEKIELTQDTADTTSYDATIWLAGSGTTDTTDDVFFTLDDVNGPTANTLGNAGKYKLAANVNEVAFTSTMDAVGADGFEHAGSGTLKELTFEWRAVGELVASDDAEGNAVDNLLTGSNENNLFRGKGGDDVLNGSGGDDTYQFLGTFGNDKVFDFSGNDTISIGADFTDVWLERQGRRGDELEIKVAGQDTSGTISIGRQFNPHSQIASVENIQFGLTADGQANGEKLGLAIGNNQGGNIKVLRDGEDAIHAHAERETYIYTNTNEMRGDATVKFLFSDQNSENHTYTPVGGTETTDTWSWMSYNFEIEYADGRVDEFEVKADTNDTFTEFNSMDGSIGQTIAFLSQGGAVQFDTNSNDATIGITNNTETGKTDYSLLGVDGGADLLLFSLEYIDATNYA